VKYDAVIVGASVAGLSTAAHLAKAGWRVMIVDRRHAIGVPVRCGEATGNRAELSRFTAVDETWIACDIGGFVAHVNDSPGLVFPVPDGGVMLHRDLFERSLAHDARARGAEILLDTPVTGLFRENGRWAGVALENGGRIEASYIVGADGAESYIGRAAGITAPLHLNEVACTVQYRLKSDFCNDGFLHFFVGKNLLPYGYIWVFPKGSGMVTVGGGRYRNSPGWSSDQPSVQYSVDRFVKERCGMEPPRETLVTGAIPVTPSPRRLTKGNVVLVGDAARQANPLTAGGIMNALEAAESAARSLIASRTAGTTLVSGAYSAEWRRNQRRQHKLFMLLREIVFSLPEQKLLPLLRTAFSLANHTIDRSKPFKLPFFPSARFLFHVAPLTIRHIWVLFK
jgi:digeranylgeranylglycerophospholipid reductase